MNNKKIKKGFTLIELLVTIALIGVLSAIAIPNYQKLLVEAQVDSDTSVIINALRTVQSNALAPDKSGVVAGYSICGYGVHANANSVFVYRVLSDQNRDCGQLNNVNKYKYPNNNNLNSNVSLLSTIDLEKSTASVQNSLEEDTVFKTPFADKIKFGSASSTTITLSAQSNPSIQQIITINEAGLITVQ